MSAEQRAEAVRQVRPIQDSNLLMVAWVGQHLLAMQLIELSDLALHIPKRVTGAARSTGGSEGTCCAGLGELGERRGQKSLQAAAEGVVPMPGPLL